MKIRGPLVAFNLALTVLASFQGRMYLLYPLDKYVGGLIFLVSVAAAVAIHGSYPERHDTASDFPELMTEGPYALCRHPFYLSLMGVQVGTFLYMDSFLGLVAFLFTLPLWYLLILKEERDLLMHWGEKYEEYMRRTPMIIPRIRRS